MIRRFAMLFTLGFASCSLLAGNSDLPPLTYNVLNGKPLTVAQTTGLMKDLFRQIPPRLKTGLAPVNTFDSLHNFLYLAVISQNEDWALVQYDADRYVMMMRIREATIGGYQYAILLKKNGERWNYIADNQDQLTIMNSPKDPYCIGPDFALPGGRWASAKTVDLDGDGAKELILQEEFDQNGAQHLFVLSVGAQSVRIRQVPATYNDFASAANTSDPPNYSSLCAHAWRFQPAANGSLIPVCNDERGILRLTMSNGEVVILDRAPPSPTRLDLNDRDLDLRWALAMASPQVIPPGTLKELLRKDIKRALGSDASSHVATPKKLTDYPFDEGHLYETCQLTSNKDRKVVLYVGDYGEATAAENINWSSLVVGPLAIPATPLTLPAKHYPPEAKVVGHGPSYLVIEKRDKFPAPALTLDDNDPTLPVRTPFFGLGRYFTNYQRIEAPLCALLAPGAKQFAQSPDSEVIFTNLWAKYKNSDAIMVAQPTIWIKCKEDGERDHHCDNDEGDDSDDHGVSGGGNSAPH